MITFGRSKTKNSPFFFYKFKLYAFLCGNIKVKSEFSKYKLVVAAEYPDRNQVDPYLL